MAFFYLVLSEAYLHHVSPESFRYHDATGVCHDLIVQKGVADPV